MIEKIATDISNTLNNSTPSRDFDGLVGMGAHMEKMKLSLCLESDEVRMIGIWGSTGIGKSTIARFLFSKHSHQFQFSVFMENIRIRYPKPCYNEYVAQLHLQTEFLSKTFKHNLSEVPHLGVLQERLHDKKVLVILDDVDRLGQVDALAGKTDWFGPGSRVVITTEDRKLLKAHQVNHIYNVDFPYSDEALQIFCMNAFGQNSPKDGFEELASEVAYYAGKLPLALKVMGSYFRGMSTQEWENALPSGSIERVVELLANTFFNVRQGLDVLDEKSLITINSGNVEIHILLSRLGREIVRKKYGSELGKYSIREPGKRQFLVDTRDISEVFNDDTAGSSSVIGINLPLFDITEDIICTSERAFERMSNLQFLRVYGDNDRLYFSQNLNSISRKLRLLDWKSFPMKRLPLNFNPEFLVRLYMQESKLEKLWDGIQPLKYLKSMELSHSKNLKELPDLSTATNLELLLLIGFSSLVKLPSSLGNATNLERLDLSRCSSLVELPSSVGKATNLYSLHLTECSSLVELPFSIGNATSLKDLNLTGCSSLVELPFSIGNFHKLQRLNMTGCSKLKVLPININMESLHELDLSDCSQLKSFPEISTSVTLLNLLGTAIEEVPPSIRSWPHLLQLGMSYCENLRKFPYTLESTTELHLSDIEITLLGPWVKDLSGLRRLGLNGMRKLVVLPQLPDSLLFLDAENCESLKRLDWSFRNINICLNFINCFKLNDEARSLIILTLNRAAVLPGWIEPYFRQPTRGNLTVKLDERPLHSSLRLKVCILLVNKVEHGPRFECMHLFYRIMEKQNDLTVPYKLDNQCLPRAVTGHLYTVELEVEVTSKELFFEIRLSGD